MTHPSTQLVAWHPMRPLLDFWLVLCQFCSSCSTSQGHTGLSRGSGLAQVTELRGSRRLGCRLLAAQDVVCAAPLVVVEGPCGLLVVSLGTLHLVHLQARGRPLSALALAS